MHAGVAQTPQAAAKAKTCVLRMRFGIGMNTNHTQEEVGQQFPVTREPSARSRRKRCAS